MRTVSTSIQRKHAMKRIFYPGTSTPVEIGDLVQWLNDEEPSKVIFIVSTGQFPEDEANSSEWFRSEYGEGIMIDTPEAGWVLESEDCENIILLRSVLGTR